MFQTDGRMTTMLNMFQTDGRMTTKPDTILQTDSRMTIKPDTMFQIDSRMTTKPDTIMFQTDNQKLGRASTESDIIYRLQSNKNQHSQ